MGAPPATNGAKKGKKKLVLLFALLLLLGGGGGAWFSGWLPRLLGKGDTEERGGHEQVAGHASPAEPGKPAQTGHGAKPVSATAQAGHGGKSGGDKAEPGSPFMDLPDIVANLNGGPRRTVFVKLKAKLELAKPEDEAAVKAAMPRVLDFFQGYLREMRPEEMRGSASTYRLREELLARTNLAVPNARVVAVLFTEVLVQ